MYELVFDDVGKINFVRIKLKTILASDRISTLFIHSRGASNLRVDVRVGIFADLLALGSF